jgi:hypothetical protein
MMVHEPTDAELQRSLVVAWVLIVIAVLSQCLALVLPRPISMQDDLGGWFGRSGAITTVFALLTETVLVRAKLSITPAGFGWVGVNEQRAVFIPKFNKPEWTIFILIIVGTIIWAYGDIPFK